MTGIMHRLASLDQQQIPPETGDMAQMEDDRDDGVNFFRGVVNALAITALFVAVGVGFAVITG